MTVSKLQRMFGVDVELKTPKVPYRETIKKRAENVEGKLKKQTGGKGMFGVCYLTIEPLPRGGGIEFVDEIVGGAIPRNLIPAVEKGVLEACDAGPLAGYPVVDVRVRCIDGKYHSVDSNEMAFKLAGSFGFKSRHRAGEADPARAGDERARRGARPVRRRRDGRPVEPPRPRRIRRGRRAAPS